MQESVLYIVLVLLCVVIYLLLNQKKNKEDNKSNEELERLNKKYKDGVRVGTIDLFQGQEAKVVLISQASSDAESLPRHKDFFFSRNRLNVAISRAENVAIVIFNPNLLLAQTNSIEEMRLMNNFCKLLKYKIKFVN